MHAEQIASIDAELAALRADNERRARAKRDRIANTKTARANAEAAQIEEIDSLRRSLTQDLKLSDQEATLGALFAKRTATPGWTARLWSPLQRLWHSITSGAFRGPNPEAARLSRHCLAAMGLLPKVRPGDAAFLNEAAVRALPPVAISVGEASSAAFGGQHGLLATAFGLPEPREMPPGVESPKAAQNRLPPREITYGQMGPFFGHKLVDEPSEAEAARRKELALISRRWELAKEARREEYRQALIEQRLAIVAACDKALAELPLGEGFYWARLARGIAALRPIYEVGEANEMLTIGPAQIIALAKASGARFTITDKKD